MRHSLGIFVATGAVFLAGGAPVQAQVFPSKQIVMVVPFPPGGSTDTTTRMLSKKLSENMGQPVVVDNRPGGGGVSGAVAVKNANPDGYTLYVGHVGTLAVDVHLHEKLDYDPVKDFRPISPFMSFASFLVVPAASPARSVVELVAYAKSKRGGLSFTSQGHGTAGQLLGEILKAETGAPLVHIPMKGAAPAVAEVVSGRADLLFSSYISAGPFIRDGRLRMLAIASNVRARAQPDIPTVSELGIPGVEFLQWFGILAPAKTVDPIIRKLNLEVVKAARSPEVEKFVTEQAAEVITATPEEFAKMIAADSERYGRVVRRLGAKVD